LQKLRKIVGRIRAIVCLILSTQHLLAVSRNRFREIANRAGETRGNIVVAIATLVKR
jgi:hypothetical protein